jgi:hypothetical protein
VSGAAPRPQTLNSGDSSVDRLLPWPAVALREGG